MHELPVMEKILKIAVSHAQANNAQKVVRICLRVGELTDLNEEWMQRYFNYVSKGTLAESAALQIEWSPVIFRCDPCEKVFSVNVKEQRDFLCPSCGSGKVVLVNGREFFVKQLEVM